MSMVGQRSNQRRRRKSLNKGKRWYHYLCSPWFPRLLIAVGRIVVEVIKAFYDDRN